MEEKTEAFYVTRFSFFFFNFNDDGKENISVVAKDTFESDGVREKCMEKKRTKKRRELKTDFKNNFWFLPNF